MRALAEQLYLRVDWRWAQNGGATVTHGWTPERGFLPYRWEGFNEALLLYVLGLGSPMHALPEESYLAWTSTYRWKTLYGQELLYGGPLFMHQLSHVWIDFREIQDAYMRSKGIDYFENSRRATYVQQAYRFATPKDSGGTASISGALQPATGQGPPRVGSTVCPGASWGIGRGGCRMGPTTARSRRGRWWPHCRSRRKSSCPAFSIAWSVIPPPSGNTDSSAASTRRSVNHRVTEVGSLVRILPSIRVQSS